jgi:hypothetical protein
MRSMGRPLDVPLSSPSATVIGIVPTMRPSDQRPSTCVPPSTSRDIERLDASGGHAQDKAASAAAVSNVVPLASLVVVQVSMMFTCTWVGTTGVCGGG